MTMFNLVAAAFILSAAMATQAFAQAAVSEPGAYAFYHPNGPAVFGPTQSAPSAMAMIPQRSVRLARHGATMHRFAAKHSNRYSAE